MNKSEIELQNISKIINEMPHAERETCLAMVASLMASIGNPIHGQTFMIAVAFTNCQVAVHNIKMGLVNEDGSIPEKFMQGDGKAKPMAPHAAKVAAMTVVQNAIPSVAKIYAKGGVVGSAKQSVLMGEVPSETVVPRETLLAISVKASDVVKGRAAAIEARAKEIYEGWQAKDGFLKWVEGGNSLMQTEARYQARKELEAKETIPAWATHKLQDGEGTWHYVRQYENEFGKYWQELNETMATVHLFTPQSYVDGTLTKLGK